LFYDFDTLDRHAGGFSNLGGRELDLYAEWLGNDHLFVMPVLGFYKPDASAEAGGSQLGGSRTNVYGQLIIATQF